MHFADTPAIEYDLIAGRIIGMLRSDDFTAEIDAGDERKFADDRRAPGQREAVLVI